MKQLTAEEILANFQQFLQTIEENISDEERRERLLKVFEKFQDRIMFAPASSEKGRHGAYPGGYIVHVLTIVKCAKELYSTWKHLGADLNGFTFEELMFCALVHDLGKLGDKNFEYYLPNSSEWHVKNQGKFYVSNPDIPHMLHCDRTLYLLQTFGIKVTQNEWIALRTHDGPYIEANRAYYLNWEVSKQFKNSLPELLHSADLLASRIESYRERE